jgi:uncharacterized protein
MNNPLWRQSVMAYIRAEAQPKDKFGHQPRLYALAAQIGKDMEYDDDVLFAAAWMHDLGVYIGHRPSNQMELERWNHVPYTIARTRELLAACGFPFEKLDGVCEAIRTHQPFDEPKTTEAIILRDADILEQLGAIGALRALAKVGRDTRYPTFSSVLPVLQRAADELPGKIRLPAAQRLAEPRVEVLKIMITAITSEAGDLLF